MSSMTNMTEQLVNEQTIVAEEAKPTKADKARTLFTTNWPTILGGKVARKDVINLLKKQAGLTQHGAATYYQNMVTKAREGKLKQYIAPTVSDEQE